MNQAFFKLAILTGAMMASSVALAATQVNVAHEKSASLTSMLSTSAANQFTEVSRHVDQNETAHIRLKQYYHGYPVWGGEVILHVPNGKSLAASGQGLLSAAKQSTTTMNGYYYNALDADLQNTPASVFSEVQAQKALTRGIDQYYAKVGGKPVIKDQKTQLIIYIDQANKAHYAYQVSFYAEPVNEMKLPAKPTYILDAVTLQTYKQWDDIKTALSNVYGGGNGGNPKMGMLTYDGLAGRLPRLSMQRDNYKRLCFLQNSNVVVRDYRNRSAVSSFSCTQVNNAHNRVYWNGTFDKAHGGNSPGNDALYAGAVVKSMYQDWYKVPVLKNPNGTPMLLTMVVHLRIDNAYWDGAKMSFGDGVSYFYPLTSLGVGAHEVSHGFTEQHSNLNYDGQSGGMNESFSDMAAMAAEYYKNATPTWQIGGEVLIGSGSLRYMDQPSRDCGGGTPGDNCSIDNASQYTNGLDVHYSSGVYNRFFYLLSTSTGWTARKAFEVMVKANMDYWTSTTSFTDGACGVLSAATALSYNTSAITTAFTTVGIDTSGC